MRIVIETVDHKDQRYDTVGDWQTGVTLHVRDADESWDPTPVDLLIRISRMPDWRSEALVAVHELVEAVLCQHAGITAEAVDSWDMGPGKDMDEPGDDPSAPYHGPHMAADAIERQLASALDVDWTEHELNIEKAGE